MLNTLPEQSFNNVEKIIRVFDTETTGIYKIPYDMKINGKYINLLTNEELSHLPYIIQLSYIDIDINNVNYIKSKDMYIKLPKEITIPEEATKIHKITDKKLSIHGINKNTAILYFMEYFYTVDILVGHNIRFDFVLLLVEIIRCRNGYEEGSQLYNAFNDYYYMIVTKKKECTMTIGKKICNLTYFNEKYNKLQPKSPKLIELYYYLFANKKIDFNLLHDSLYDCIITLMCYYKIYKNKDLTKENKKLNTIYKLLC